MRLAVSGTSCLGKSTLIKDFIQEWPIYKTESSTYRDLIKSKNYPHSKNVTKEGQWAILNHMIDELQKHDKDDNIIYDRCPLDCLVYSLWAYDHNTSDIDDAFISKIIPIVKNSLHHLDIIWFIPISKFNKIPIEDDGMREIDPEYIGEIDNIFKGLLFQYQKNIDSNVFFDSKNCPAIIEVFGTREERIQYIRNYLDVSGNLIGEENSVLSEENLTDMYNLLKGQEDANKKEVSEKKQRAMIKDFINLTKN
jgi:hypothetical protein